MEEDEEELYLKSLRKKIAWLDGIRNFITKHFNLKYEHLLSSAVGEETFNEMIKQNPYYCEEWSIAHKNYTYLYDPPVNRYGINNEQITYSFGNDETEKKMKRVASICLHLGHASMLSLVVTEPYGILAMKRINRDYIDNHIKVDVLDLGRKVKKFEHPNVVKLFGVIAEPGRYLVFMEFMPICLVNILEIFYPDPPKNDKKFIPEKFIWYTVKQILDALEYLYNKDFPHGNLSASEVFFDRDGIVKLVSFMASPIHSRTKISAGTDVYIAPEILKNVDAKFNQRSDIWSLGLIMFRMAVGEVPFPSHDSPPVEELLQMVQDCSQMIDSDIFSKCEMSEELRDTINECMQFDIDKRPSLEELIGRECIKKAEFDAITFLKKYMTTFDEILELCDPWSGRKDFEICFVDDSEEE